MKTTEISSTRSKMNTTEHSPSLYTTKISIDDGQFVGTLKMQPKEFVIIARRPDEIDGGRRYSWLYKQIADTLISVDVATSLFVRVVNKQTDQERMLRLNFDNQFERKFFARRFQLLSRLYKRSVTVVKTALVGLSETSIEFNSSSYLSSSPVNSVLSTIEQQGQLKGEEMGKQLIGTKHCLDIDCPRIPPPKPVSDRSLLSPLDGTPPKKDQIKFFPTTKNEVVLPANRYLYNRSEPKQVSEHEMPPLRALRGLAARTTKEDLARMKRESDGSRVSSPGSLEERESVSSVSTNSGELNSEKPTPISRASSGPKDELISKDNLARLAGARNIEKKAATVDDMLSTENLKKLAKTNDNINSTTTQKIKVPVKLEDGNDGEQMILQAEIKLTLGLYIDLKAALEALKIQNPDERVEKISKNIKFETSLCDLTFV